MNVSRLARVCACMGVSVFVGVAGCGPDRSNSEWGYDVVDVRGSSDARGDSATRPGADASASRDAAVPPSDASTSTDARPLAPCDAPRTLCGGECVDPTANAAHCGGCNHACARNETCSAGRCVAVATETGAPCGSDAACGGAAGACVTSSYGWPGGYCIYGCRSNADCPGSGYCNLRATTPYCLRSCGDDTDCRSGYQCVPISESQAICYPRCRTAAALVCGAYRCDPDYDICDTSPCSVDTDCSSGSRCDVGSSRCLCTAATDCGAGFACVTSTGRCGCASDSVCGAGRRCDLATGRCL